MFTENDAVDNGEHKMATEEAAGHHGREKMMQTVHGFSGPILVGACMELLAHFSVDQDVETGQKAG